MCKPFATACRYRTRVRRLRIEGLCLGFHGACPTVVLRLIQYPLENPWMRVITLGLCRIRVSGRDHIVGNPKLSFGRIARTPSMKLQTTRPRPDVPVIGTLRVTSYAVAFAKRAKYSIQVTNKLAETDGRVELYNAKGEIFRCAGEGEHQSAEIKRDLPLGVSQWRIALTSSDLGENEADVFLLDCSNHGSGCRVAIEATYDPRRTLLTLDDPTPGEWRIVIRTRLTTGQPLSYRLRDATLSLASGPTERQNQGHPSGETWTVPLSSTVPHPQYAAFRIAVPLRARYRNGVGPRGDDPIGSGLSPKRRLTTSSTPRSLTPADIPRQVARLPSDLRRCR